MLHHCNKNCKSSALCTMSRMPQRLGFKCLDSPLCFGFQSSCFTIIDQYEEYQYLILGKPEFGSETDATHPYTLKLSHYCSWYAKLSRYFCCAAATVCESCSQVSSGVVNLTKFVEAILLIVQCGLMRFRRKKIKTKQIFIKCLLLFLCST